MATCLPSDLIRGVALGPVLLSFDDFLVFFLVDAPPLHVGAPLRRPRWLLGGDSLGLVFFADWFRGSDVWFRGVALGPVLLSLAVIIAGSLLALIITRA